MLHLIGTGIWRWDDISVRGIEICRRADAIYLDEYTRRFDEAELEKLKAHIGKEIISANRKELEENLGFLERAKEEEIVLLVPGDPLLATTHITVLSEARKKGIDAEVVHGSNIHAALIGEAGLHIYKFGGSCTIPMKEKGIKPYSTYDKIAENMKRGLHTLVFFDTDPIREMPMREAIGILEEIESEKGLNVCGGENWIIIGCRIGSTEQKLIYGMIKQIKQIDFKGPCAAIFPGKLHFSEEEFLETLKL